MTRYFGTKFRSTPEFRPTLTTATRLHLSLVVITSIWQYSIYEKIKVMPDIC